MTEVIVDDIQILLGIDVADYTPDNVEAIEAYIVKCREYMRDEGESLVEDAIYDRLVEILEETKPDSHIFQELWDEPELAEEDLSGKYNGFLRSNPMQSIQTIKSWEDPKLQDFTELVENFYEESEESYELFYAFKLNGHGVRVVYNDGSLVYATSRARATKGRDITRQMRNILGAYNSKLDGYGIVEIRGEVCLRVSRLDKAREFNGKIKNPFSAVASLNKPSSTKEENELLSFLAYRYYDESTDFDTREEFYQHLEDLGFEVPRYISEEVEPGEDILSKIQDTFASLEEEDEAGENDFFCDGVIVEVNNLKDGSQFGSFSSVAAKSNVALKVGRWAQDAYHGYVQAIVWKQGKSKLSPVAIVADQQGIAEFDSTGTITNMDEMGVLTSQGNKVANIPLYEPKNIIILDAYPGNELFFRYGSEAGVVPTTPDGKLLTDSAIQSLIEF